MKQKDPKKRVGIQVFPETMESLRTLGEVRIFDVITHYRGEITIECVNPYTGNTMEAK